MSYRAMKTRIAYIDRRLGVKRDYPSARTLARDFAEEYGDEVSERTIKRDIEQMRDQGAPIAYDASRHGYWYTDDTWRLPALTLTEGDLLALLVAERALASYRNTPYYDRLRSVFAHLAEELPERVTVTADELSGRLTVIGAPVTTIDPDVWSCVQHGLAVEHTLVLRYQTPRHSTPAGREIDPYHLVGHNGEWYVLGWSHRNEEVRIYALSRVHSCTDTGRMFTRPANFNIARYLDPHLGIFVNEPAVTVTIRFASEVSSQIRERTWHPHQELIDEPDGSLLLRYPTNQLSQSLFWISQWGPNAEILAPADLRSRAADWFTRAAARYDESGM